MGNGWTLASCEQQKHGTFVLKEISLSYHFRVGLVFAGYILLYILYVDFLYTTKVPRTYLNAVICNVKLEQALSNVIFCDFLLLKLNKCL